MTDAPGKNKIIFVPGKNPKPRHADHRALLWHCLLHGVDLVDPAVAQALAARPEDFELASWNELYYEHIKDIDEDVPWIEAMCRKTGPDATDLRESLSWRRKRARLIYTLADYFPALIPLAPDPAVKSTILETERYFSNQDGIGDQVREIVKAPLRRMLDAGDRVLVIGHSMGSVIVYDALWELTHRDSHPGRIDLFLTLGSPLGMNFVQERLYGFHDIPPRYPCNIRRWVNIAAHGDVTALDTEIRDDFLAMIKQGCSESIEDRHRGVFNYFRNEKGLNVHRSYGYLVEQHVARTIAGWWQGNGDGLVFPAPVAGGAGMA